MFFQSTASILLASFSKLEARHINQFHKISRYGGATYCSGYSSNENTKAKVRIRYHQWQLFGISGQLRQITLISNVRIVRN